MRNLDPNWVEDRLKQISAQLIEAHRSGNTPILEHYAAQAGIKTKQHSKRLFMQIIQIYHPDRSGLFMQRLSAAGSEESEEIERIQKLLEYREFASRGSAFGGFGRRASGSGQTQSAHGGRQQSGYGGSRGSGQDFSYEEEYGYDEDDFDDIESSGAADYENDPYDTEDEEEFFEGSFMEALKRELFGNLDLFPSRAEIEQLEGELDLSDYGINDLSGVEYCRNVTNLNLALNEIDNIWPLRSLIQLEFLDLSSNDLEDADELANLVNLKEIDLSFNQIDDMNFLEKIPGLTAVSIAGNPVRDSAVLNRLKARGILVIA